MLNDAYNAGTPRKNGGMVIDTYLLVGNNCTTITCGALREGGIIIPMINTPAGFKDYMESKAGAMSNNYINSLGQH